MFRLFKRKERRLPSPRLEETPAYQEYIEKQQALYDASPRYKATAVLDEKGVTQVLLAKAQLTMLGAFVYNPIGKYKTLEEAQTVIKFLSSPSVYLDERANQVTPPCRQ